MSPFRDIAIGWRWVENIKLLIWTDPKDSKEIPERNIKFTIKIRIMIKVGVAGFGTIGKRVVDAINAQSDMEIVGIAKTSSSLESEFIEHRYGLFGVTDENVQSMDSAGHDVIGSLEELVNLCDIIVDCSPSGHGERNKQVYVNNKTPAVFQGGENATVAKESFNSYVAKSDDVNYNDSEYTRVVSCNTTGLSRIITPLSSRFDVQDVEATLMRRAGDPRETSRGPINEVVRSHSIPSHHAGDVNELLPELDIHTMAVKVPTTSMHMHSVRITLDEKANSVLDFLHKKNRISIVPNKYTVDSAGGLTEIANLESRPFGSVWENTVWENTFDQNEDTLRFFQGVHQRSITVPETIDAVRTMMGGDIEESIETTDKSLGIDKPLLK